MSEFGEGASPTEMATKTPDVSSTGAELTPANKFVRGLRKGYNSVRGPGAWDKLAGGFKGGYDKVRGEGASDELVNSLKRGYNIGRGHRETSTD